VRFLVLICGIYFSLLQDVKPEVADAKPEIVEKAVVEPEHADATNGEVEDSEESSQFATPLESEEFERPLPDDGRKRYNNTFLLSIAPLCKDLPPQIEMATLSALQWVEGMGEKPLAPPRPPDRDWKSGPRGPPSGMPGGPPGMRGGGGRGRGRGNPTGIESETWERGKALPPMPGNQYGGRGPPPGMRMPSGPLPALHKTDSAYKIGNVVTDDPEEEKAQKALKSTLNKITPQNFEKIKEQIIAKINERKKAKTLSAFIDQIFDKALVETTFAELYAKLVAGLNPALPELEGDDGTPVQFRRTLLNKCQEEFERGAVAMKAVAEREKRDHEKPAEEPAVEPAVEAPKEAAEVEEGEISLEEQEKLNAAEEAKRQDKAQADAEVKARKRMLGNIIFVGQLYRFGVLTESVMHTCIKQLLEESQNPRSEDIECLCKLLTTVGRPMDGSNRTMKQNDESGEAKPVSTRDLMAAYFIRIDVLSRNEALDSRHRFMLADLIDLRRNNWVLRRATEGPKKIDDIHRDAAMERSRSQMLDRQASRGGRDQRGPPRPFDNRVDAPIRTMNRVGSQEDSLGQSFRPGGRPAPPPR
jgi:translation initiation factor 4G